MRRRSVLALAVLALALLSLGGRLVATQIAQAAQTWNVQAGGDGPQIAGGGLTTIGWFPSTITINAGDTVSWSFPSAEPHGVAFEAGQVPPFAFQISPGPNPGDLDISKIFLPTNLDRINGVFDPSIPFSSGAPQGPPGQAQPFNLTFNTTGVFSYDCQIHGPVMSGTIVVLPASSALSETPAQESARGNAELGAALGGAAGALTQQAPAGAPVPVTGGSTVFPALVGFGPGANVAALAFFPSNLTVHRGDTVVFTQPDQQEIHTVTFLSGAEEPPLVDVVPQAGGPPQILFRARVVVPSGGNTYTGSGILHSGVLFPGTSFSVTMDAPAGTYQFQCLLHDDDFNMKGTITVVE